MLIDEVVLPLIEVGHLESWVELANEDSYLLGEDCEDPASTPAQAIRDIVYQHLCAHLLEAYVHWLAEQQQ